MPLSKTTRFISIGVLLLSCLLFCDSAKAQRVALRTNLVDWATLSPNLTLETRLSRTLSLGLGFVGNPFPFRVAGNRFNNFRFQPELRYWFNRPMARNYMGLAAIGALYDIRLNNTVRQGDIFGLGLTYGYALVLNRHWNVEFSLGVGVAKMRYKSYPEGTPAPKWANRSCWVPVPLNTGISFTYIFK